jgi:hypothetical protein
VRDCTVGVKTAVSELIALTNIAFHVDDNSRPIFVLDNGHQFAELKTDLPSKVQGTHNGLSAILTSLTQWRCPVIVAGTTDKEIHLFADFSTFVVEHIPMTPLGRKHWNLMGQETTAKLNKRRKTNIVWQTVDVAESCDVDEQIKDSDDVSMEDVGGLDVATSDQDADAMQMDSSEDDAHLRDTISPQDNNVALLGMFYHGSQVPRLIKIAIEAWFEGTLKATSYMQITEDFEGKLKDTF